MAKISYKTRILDAVENLGQPASWTELHELIIMEHVKAGTIDLGDYMANKQKYRGWWCGPLNTSVGGYYGPSKPGYMMRPSKCDSRYLEKTPAGYVVRYAA